MLKFNNRPLWYKIWAISVAISALYFLLKFLVSEPTPQANDVKEIDT